MKAHALLRDPSAARHSFILRVWREEGGEGWWGWVQHTRSGESAAAQDLTELLAFVESRTGKLNRAVQERLK